MRVNLRFLLWIVTLSAFAGAALATQPEKNPKNEVADRLPEGKGPSPRLYLAKGGEGPVPLPPALVERFEGAWPGAWLIYSNGVDAWDRTSFRRWDGLYSIYCAEQNGNAPGPYPPNMWTWAVWGPFDMSSSYGGWVDFLHWTWTEGGWNDVFGCGIGPDFNPASPDWTQFSYGFYYTGNFSPWRRCSDDSGPFYGPHGIDLTAGFGPFGTTRVTYDPNVWIAFYFESNFALQFEGSYVDSVLILIGNPNLVGNTQPGGWSHPIVPSGSTGGTTVPPTLPGGAITYVDHSMLSELTAEWITIRDPYYEDIFLDDIRVYRYTMSNLPQWSGDWRTQLDFPTLNIRGGRHTLRHFVDCTNAIPTETNENDNTWGYQWVWSPVLLSGDNPLTYNTAPRKDDPEVPLIYYNCDGFSADIGQRWNVVGMKPPATDNYDLRLYSDYAGSDLGFSNVLESSDQPSNGTTEFIAVDGHSAPGISYPGVYDNEVVGASGTYYVHWCQNDDSLEQGWNPLPPLDYAMDSSEVVHAYETYLEAGTPYLIGLYCVSGGCDLGLALYSSTDGDYYKERGGWVDFVDGVRRSGADTLKYFSSLFTPSVSDHYGFVVWHNTTGQASGTYRIWIGGASVLLYPDQADSTDPGVPLPYTLTVENNGGYGDVVDITTTGTNPGWTVGLYDSTGVNLLTDTNANGIPDVGFVPPGGIVDFMVELTPPASAPAAEMDTTEVWGTFSQVPTVQDNAFLYTTVNMVASVTVEPDQSDTTSPGVGIYYGLTVTNDGNAPDCIDITTSGTLPAWTVELFESDSTTLLIDHDGDAIPDVDTLAPWGGQASIVVRVTPPSTAPSGTVDTTLVTGTSSNIPSVSDGATLITTIEVIASVSVEPDQSDTTSPGVGIYYGLTVTNDGNAPDCVDITTSGTLPAWTVDLFESDSTTLLTDHDGDGIPDVDTLAPWGGQASIVVRVTPPSTAPSGTVDTTLVTGTSSNIPSVSDGATLITTVEVIASVSVEPDQSDTTSPGIGIYYGLTVTNGGNAPDCIDITTSGTLPAWTVELFESDSTTLLTDHDGDAIPDVDTLAPWGGQASIVVRVTPPSTAPSGTVDTTLVTGTSSNIPSVSDGAILVTRLGTIADVEVEPDQQGTTPPGVSLDYVLTVTNNGNAQDSVQLSSSGTRPGWLVGLFDSSGTQPITSVSLAPYGGSARIRLRLTPPANEPAGTVDSTVVRGESSNVPGVFDQASVRTAVATLLLSLALDPDQGRELYSEQSYFYHLRAVLEGNAQDVVDLEARGTHPNWSLALFEADETTPLRDSDNDGLLDLGMVSPGVEREFVVRITAPQLTIEGPIDTNASRDLSVIYGFASLDPSLSDSATVVTTALPGLDVHNFASPFKARTQFVFSLPEDGRVTLVIYNRLGEKVKTLISNRPMTRGIHLLPWNAENDRGGKVAPGVYLYRFTFEGSTFSRSLIKKTAVLP